VFRWLTINALLFSGAALIVLGALRMSLAWGMILAGLVCGGAGLALILAPVLGGKKAGSKQKGQRG
jgi:hypothetical protein